MTELEQTKGVLNVTGAGYRVFKFHDATFIITHNHRGQPGTERVLLRFDHMGKFEEAKNE